jgi:hypothetical protein
MVAAAGAGPTPIPYKCLTSESLAEAIKVCLTPEAATAAIAISAKMKTESGVEAAVQSFHANLPQAEMRCDFFPEQTASWVYKKQKTIRMSKMAAGILMNGSKIARSELRM